MDLKQVQYGPAGALLEQTFVFHMNISDVGLGMVLSDEMLLGDHTIFFLSHEPTEQCYAAIENENLALKWAIESFQY